jgi:hypothetical protein
METGIRHKKFNVALCKVINIMKNEDEGELSFKVGQSGSISLRR